MHDKGHVCAHGNRRTYRGGEHRRQRWRKSAERAAQRDRRLDARGEKPSRMSAAKIWFLVLRGTSRRRVPLAPLRASFLARNAGKKHSTAASETKSPTSRKTREKWGTRSSLRVCVVTSLSLHLAYPRLASLRQAQGRLWAAFLAPLRGLGCGGSFSMPRP